MADLGNEKKKTAMQKGNALEQAVGEIERLILSSTPAAEGKTFKVEYKKIVGAEGVKHEIDIYVTVCFGPGYTGLFIFECKNWANPVGKNEIIVFSEKIKSIGATQGYFVAKAFTADAIAQAKKDNRMTLRVATEHDPLTMPSESYGVRERVMNWQLAVQSRDGLELRAAVSREVQFHGELSNFETLLREWSRIEAREKLWDFCSGKADGLYDFEYEFVREFQSEELEIYGKDVAKIHVSVKSQVQIVNQAVESSIDVEGRGRIIQLAPVEMPGFFSISDSVIIMASPEEIRE